MSQETSTSGQDARPAIATKKALLWNKRIAIIKPDVKQEWVVILEHYGFRGLEPLFSRIRENEGFHSIISAQPPSILPKHAISFYYTLREIEMDSNLKRFNPAMASFRMPVTGIPNNYISFLPLVLEIYGLKDEGDIYWIDDVSLDAVQKVF